jgi:hypothetical protein
MSDKLGQVISQIVHDGSDAGYQDDELLVLFVLKKVLAIEKGAFGDSESFSPEEETHLVEVCPLDRFCCL